MSMLGATSVSVLRRSGAFVDGTWTVAATSTLTVTASVQELNGREFLALPEAQRIRHPIKLYTEADALRTADEDTGAMADIVTWNGDQYEVDTVQNRTAGPLPHWKFTALKLKAGG